MLEGQKNKPEAFLGKVRPLKSPFQRKEYFPRGSGPHFIVAAIAAAIICCRKFYWKRGIPVDSWQVTADLELIVGDGREWHSHDAWFPLSGRHCDGLQVRTPDVGGGWRCVGGGGWL